MKEGQIKYINNSVVVIDNNKGNLSIKEYKYQDNIKDIISTENVIEELENEKDSIKNNINNNFNLIKQWKKINKFLLITLCSIPFVSVLCGVLGGVDKVAPIIEGLKNWQFVGISSAVISSIMITPAIAVFKSAKKQTEKENNGLTLGLQELENELSNNKKLLDELQNDKTKNRLKEAKQKGTENIDNIHLERLKQIRDQINSYYQIDDIENSKTYSKTKNNK